MLVLAIDTATPAVTAGVVDLRRRSATVLAERVTLNARAHGELLTPHLIDAIESAGAALRDLDAVVCGVGPGPYTGLRAGIVTAAALSHSLGVPAHPVCTLDAIAVDAARASEQAGPFLVVTDARRREVYWAAYDASGRRTSGPDVGSPTELGSSVPRRVEFAHPGPRGLVGAAEDALLSGTRPEPLTPLYLRRPDAVEPGARKRVTT